MKSQPQSDDQARVYAQGLRRVALASVLALAVVLPLAAVTAQHGGGPVGNAGSSHAGRAASGPASD